MTDQELRDLVANLAVSQAKTDEQLKELKDSQAKTDEQLKESVRSFNQRIMRLEELVGNIGNNQGDVAEEYFINSLKDNLTLADMDFDTLMNNVGVKHKGIRDEFDILLVNGDSVALIEVKYKVHPNILEKLPKKIEHLKLLPQYKNYKVYAGIAGFYIPDEVIEEATKRRYFVLQRNGNVLQTFTDNLRAA